MLKQSKKNNRAGPEGWMSMFRHINYKKCRIFMPLFPTPPLKEVQPCPQENPKARGFFWLKAACGLAYYFTKSEDLMPSTDTSRPSSQLFLRYIIKTQTKFSLTNLTLFFSLNDIRFPQTNTSLDKFLHLCSMSSVSREGVF